MMAQKLPSVLCETTQGSEPVSKCVWWFEKPRARQDSRHTEVRRGGCDLACPLQPQSFSHPCLPRSPSPLAVTFPQTTLVPHAGSSKVSTNSLPSLVNDEQVTYTAPPRTVPSSNGVTTAVSSGFIAGAPCDPPQKYQPVAAPGCPPRFPPRTPSKARFNPRLQGRRRACCWKAAHQQELDFFPAPPALRGHKSCKLARTASLPNSSNPVEWTHKLNREEILYVSLNGKKRKRKKGPKETHMDSRKYLINT